MNVPISAPSSPARPIKSARLSAPRNLPSAKCLGEIGVTYKSGAVAHSKSRVTAVVTKATMGSMPKPKSTSSICKMAYALLMATWLLMSM